MNNEPLSTKELRERIGKEHGTHYEGCWQDHPSCMVLRLCDEIDDLRSEKNAIAINRDMALIKISWLEKDNESLENNVMMKHDEIERLKKEIQLMQISNGFREVLDDII